MEWADSAGGAVPLPPLLLLLPSPH